MNGFFTLRPKRKNVPTFVAALLAASVVAGQVVDFVTTTIGIRLGATESNPLLAPVVHNVPLFLAIKLVGTTFLVWASWKRPAAAGVVAGIYAYVGWNNVQVLLQLS